MKRFNTINGKYMTAWDCIAMKLKLDWWNWKWTPNHKKFSHTMTLLKVKGDFPIVMHACQLNTQRKCPACFSYHLVTVSQKEALFISIANVFYCIAVIALSTRFANGKNLYISSLLYSRGYYCNIMSNYCFKTAKMYERKISLNRRQC